MHLFVPEYQALECIYISNALELFSIFIDEVLDERLDVVTFDELEELQTCGVEETVSGHCFHQHPEDWLEEVFADDLLIILLILQHDDGADVLECSCYTVSHLSMQSRESLHTKFEMLLGAVHELGYPCREIFGNDEVFVPERMLFDEIAKNLYEVAIQGNLLDGQAAHWEKVNFALLYLIYRLTRLSFFQILERLEEFLRRFVIESLGVVISMSE